MKMCRDRTGFNEVKITIKVLCNTIVFSTFPQISALLRHRVKIYVKNMFADDENYIAKFLKEDYKEPNTLPHPKHILENRLRYQPEKSLVEAYCKIDPILSIGDGFYYGSYERLILQRKKGLVKPVGPVDMYRSPVTRAQEIGFWIKDPLLQDVNWTKWSKYYGRTTTELSRTLEKLRQADPLKIF